MKDYGYLFNSLKLMRHSLVHVVGEFVVASQSYKRSKTETVGEKYLGYSIDPNL
jgi:hypothetical protein